MRRPQVIDVVFRSRWRVAGVLVAIVLVVGGIVFLTRSDSTSNGGVGLVTVQMVTPTTVYAGGQGRIMRSDDGGKTWVSQQLSCTSSCAGDLRVSDIEMSGEIDGWAATSVGLFKTTDGLRWSEQPTGQAHEPAIVEFVSREQGWIVTGTVAPTESAGLTDTVVARTTDGGATWTALTNAPPDVQDLCFSSADEGWLATKTGAFHSIDGGANWTVALQAAAQTSQGSTTLQCIVPGEVWAEFTTGSATSSSSAWALGIIADGGQRYSPIAAPSAPADSTRPPPFSVIDPTAAFLVDYTQNDQSFSGTLLASDGTAGPRNPVAPLKASGGTFTPKALSFFDAEHGVLVGAAGGGRPSIYATADGGKTWTSANLPGASQITRAGGSN